HGGGPLGEREDRARLGHAAPADVIRDQPSLPRRDADELGDGLHGLRAVDRHYRFFTCVFWSPACPRKWRVGANSPSLCPTICSEMNTGTCLRPSWTAIVCPTMSGNTVLERDQVRTICLLPESFIFWMRPSSRSSTKGPFLDDLLNACPSRGDGRERSACRTPCASTACA